MAAEGKYLIQLFSVFKVVFAISHQKSVLDDQIAGSLQQVQNASVT